MTGLHDLHIWSMSTTEVALTVHLNAPWTAVTPQQLAEASREIARRFEIGHATIQVDPTGDIEDCQQASDRAL